MKIIDKVHKLTKIAILVVVAYLGYRIYDGYQTAKKGVTEAFNAAMAGIKAPFKAAKEWLNTPTGQIYVDKTSRNTHGKTTNIGEFKPTGEQSATTNTSGSQQPVINITVANSAAKQSDVTGNRLAYYCATAVVVAIAIWLLWPKIHQKRHKFARRLGIRGMPQLDLSKLGSSTQKADNNKDDDSADESDSDNDSADKSDVAGSEEGSAQHLRMDNVKLPIYQRPIPSLQQRYDEMLNAKKAAGSALEKAESGAKEPQIGELVVSHELPIELVGGGQKCDLDTGLFIQKQAAKKKICLKKYHVQLRKFELKKHRKAQNKAPKPLATKLEAELKKEAAHQQLNKVAAKFAANLKQQGHQQADYKQLKAAKLRDEAAKKKKDKAKEWDNKAQKAAKNKAYNNKVKKAVDQKRHKFAKKAARKEAKKKHQNAENWAKKAKRLAKNKAYKNKVAAIENAHKEAVEKKKAADEKRHQNAENKAKEEAKKKHQNAENWAKKAKRLAKNKARAEEEACKEIDRQMEEPHTRNSITPSDKGQIHAESDKTTPTGWGEGLIKTAVNTLVTEGLRPKDYIKTWKEMESGVREVTKNVKYNYAQDTYGSKAMAVWGCLVWDANPVGWAGRGIAWLAGADDMPAWGDTDAWRKNAAEHFGNWKTDSWDKTVKVPYNELVTKTKAVVANKSIAAMATSVWGSAVSNLGLNFIYDAVNCAYREEYRYIASKKGNRLVKLTYKEKLQKRVATYDKSFVATVGGSIGSIGLSVLVDKITAALPAQYETAAKVAGWGLKFGASTIASNIAESAYSSLKSVISGFTAPKKVVDSAGDKISGVQQVVGDKLKATKNAIDANITPK